MPTANCNSPYRFTTSEQLRQDLKKAIRDRNQSVNAISKELGIPQSLVSRFLAGQIKNVASRNLTKYCAWLSGALPPAQPSTPLAAWLTLQTYLIDVAGRNGELPPDALTAISELNSFFSSTKWGC